MAAPNVSKLLYIPPFEFELPFDPVTILNGKRGEDFLVALKQIRSLLYQAGKTNPTTIKKIGFSVNRDDDYWVMQALCDFTGQFGINYESNSSFRHYAEITIIGEELFLACYIKVLPFILLEITRKVQCDFTESNRTFAELKKQEEELEKKKTEWKSQVILIQQKMCNDRVKFITESVSALNATPSTKKRRNMEDVFFEKKKKSVGK
jgi:hypothetical protein